MLFLQRFHSLSWSWFCKFCCIAFKFLQMFLSFHFLPALSRAWWPQREAPFRVTFALLQDRCIRLSLMCISRVYTIHSFSESRQPRAVCGSMTLPLCLLLDVFFFLIAAISIRSHRIRLIALRPLAILRLSPQLSAQSEHFRCTASCAHLIVAVRFIPWWTNQMTIPPLRSQVLISVRLCHGVCFFHSL